ncbi:MAG: deoxyribodipyrimidine photo-lyase [Halanaeroarchaeum sp.]
MADDGRIIFWHRNDLRTRDNRGLVDAAARGTVVPVFCLDDALLEVAGAARVSFMLEALRDLQSWYRERGSDLLLVRADPTDAIPALAGDHDAEAVVWNEGYSGYAQTRDEAVADALFASGIDTGRVDDRYLHRPGDIRTNAGEPYSVFTYFWKKWRDREPRSSVDAPPTDRLADVSGPEVPTLATLGFNEPTASVLTGTIGAAEQRLTSFLAGPVYDYEQRRDRPAAKGTARLSQDLSFGLLGIRDVFERTEAARTDAPDEAASASVVEFQRQLAWREFYGQVLAFAPETVSENHTSFEHPIEWRNDPEEIRAWREGETGYPFVDAGMRQLRREGHIHNRPRMVVAAFLTKDLLTDWRIGYRWFRRHLVDHDTANDVGGWQWAASTGTDAHPYFRVFNPTTQGERYDPDAEYVREYVPELRGVSPELIHSWPDLADEDRQSTAPEYPAPIVDHASRRDAAIDAFERARGDD